MQGEKKAGQTTLNINPWASAGATELKTFFCRLSFNTEIVGQGGVFGPV